MCTKAHGGGDQEREERMRWAHLVLCDRIDEWVASARVLDEEAADARTRRPKVPVLQLQVGGESHADDKNNRGHFDVQDEDLEHREAVLAPADLDKLEDLERDEDEQRRELLGRLDGTPTDNGHAHRAESADNVEE
jgi:hypothetical protein